jgi:hypothetical protein
MIEPIKLSISKTLGQLKTVLIQTDVNQYKAPLQILSGSSVGMHVRHILEFYQCLLNGLVNRSVDYDARERDTRIEHDPEFACGLIQQLLHEIESLTQNLDITLYTSLDLSESRQAIPSNFFRELIYMIEHSVHHMAILKMAYADSFSSIPIPSDFGIATSTLKYKQVCAQ